jgi:hypothetical protein
MTQLGELAFTAFVADGEIKCPFCTEKKSDQKKQKLNVTNSSKELGSSANLGDPPSLQIETPALNNANIKPKHRQPGTMSTLVQNAHHVIPGNASFAKAIDLHRWLAWEVRVESHWYKELADDEDEPAGYRESNVTPLGTTNWRTGIVVRRTESGYTMREVATTQGHKVYNKVDYDINSKDNGIWLPSNNAVKKWTSLAGQKSNVTKGKDFQQAYAESAMRTSKVQFHDAHPAYSDSVLDILKEIEVKTRHMAESCRKHKENGEPDIDPWPAPQRLANVLKKLSTEIKARKLVARKGKAFEEAWQTSRFAKGFIAIR